MDLDLRRLRSAEYRARLNQCSHCGLCLETCPTYAVGRVEMDSPRGRIVLMRAAADGRVAPEDLCGAFAEHIDLCLGCRACETVCPSGVEYGALVEPVRLMLAEGQRDGLGGHAVRWLALRQLLPHAGRLRTIARLARLYQAAGLQRAVRAAAVQRLLPAEVRAAEALLPPIELSHVDYRGPAPALGTRRGQVALFHGCIQDAFLPRVNEATVRVLQRNGYEVHFPPGQTCCGAAHLHVGEGAQARTLARRNLDALLRQPCDAIINNAGGCGAMLRTEYAALLGDDPIYAAKARQLAGRVQDISEFLAGHLHVLPKGQVRARAVYVDSCHLRHVQKVVREPRDLLREIPGLELVELCYPDRCCGSAGVYNIVHAEMANEILDQKMADIAATGADMIVTSNTGCHMQLLAGVRRAGLAARVLHVVQVLDLAYGPGGEG
jgi:glycolate oxidase iron-sulfur subunit